MNKRSYVKYSVDERGIIEAELDIKQKDDIIDFFFLLAKDVFNEYEGNDTELLARLMLNHIYHEMEKRTNA